MNERIQELFQQASDYYWSLDDAVRTTGTFTANPEFLEKFAELIVRECLGFCQSEMDCREIKKHFGVEE